MTARDRRLLGRMPRWIAVVLAVALLAGAYLVFVARFYTSPVDAYRAVDEKTLEIQTTGAPRGTTWVSAVVETDATVTITVSGINWLPGPGTAYAKILTLTVHLSVPIGERQVLDSTGVRPPRVDHLGPPST